MTFATQLSAAFTPIAAVYDSASVTRALTWSQSFVESYTDNKFDLVTSHTAILDPKPYRSARLTHVPVLNVESLYALMPPQQMYIPQISQAPSSTGGTLPAGTYFWVVTAVNNAPQPSDAVGTGPMGESVASNEVTAALSGSTSSNTLSWAAVPGAVSYCVYRGASSRGEFTRVATVTGTSYTDVGAAGSPGVPTTGLVWTQLTNYAWESRTGLIYDTTGEPGTYMQTNVLSWPTVKGGLLATFDYGFPTIPQGLVDVGCRLAQQYLENPALMMQRRIGDSEARFSGSAGLVLNQLDKDILDRYSDVGIA